MILTEAYKDLGKVVYLQKIVRGILLQVSIQVGLDGLLQAAKAEAHEEWVVSFPLCHYCFQLDSQVLLKKNDSCKALKSIL